MAKKKAKPVKKKKPAKAKKPAAKKPAARKKPAPAAKAARARPAARAKKPAVPEVPAWKLPQPGETLAGVVDDYLSHLGVMLTTLNIPLRQGDHLHVKGFTTNLQQVVESMQIEHSPVESADAGVGVGIRVVDKVRQGDHIYKID